jgi:hypothetical protein
MHMLKILTIVIAVATTAHSANAAEATGDYATDLAAVYGGYQRLLAMKEACDITLPATRPANDKAFSAWQAQHQALIQELRRRVTTMIRMASQDEKDYARNLGRYEGLILQERQEYKDMLTGLGSDELRVQCQRMPEVLKSPAAELDTVYAAQLAVIRKRK